jgi:hypothetical protein
MTDPLDPKTPRKFDPDKDKPPRRFSDAEVDSAVKHIKTSNPGLWSELVSLERQKTSIEAVWPALVRLLNETKLAERPKDLANLIMAVRRGAWAEAAEQ